MPIHIKTVVEKQRGCGYKKPGGLYLIGGQSSSSCCQLPFPLTVCKCCGQGIKFSRGFTWINTDMFGAECSDKSGSLALDRCMLSQKNKRIGLMWVGESFYKTPSHFMTEAWNMGISKRIAAVPRDCEPGKTWIALAHKKCITSFPDGDGDPIMLPGVFMLFKVTAIQYVVKHTDSEKELQKLQDNGIELIQVIQEGQQQTINI